MPMYLVSVSYLSRNSLDHYLELQKRQSDKQFTT